MADTPDTVTVSAATDVFHKWAFAEVQACATEPPATRAKRMKHFSGVLAQVSKALGARDMPVGFSVTMETAYAPLAGNGITVTPGITTPADKQASMDFKTPSELSKAFGDLAARLDAQITAAIEGTPAPSLAGTGTTPAPAAPAADSGAAKAPWTF